MTNLIRKILAYLKIKSLEASRKSQMDDSFVQKLEKILPSLEDQTNYSKTFNEFLQIKRRNQQAFQLNFTLDAIQRYKKENHNAQLSIIDIGDSAGNHLIQLQALDPDIKEIASVNLDEEAVEKIRKKGIKAFHCRAEELLSKYNVKADFFISYQMVEHLTDPVRFFHDIAYGENNGVNVCDRFIVSVPYQKRSRVGFDHMRMQQIGAMQNAESVHIFELSPEDWKLLVEFSGWKVVSDKIYLQYPKWHWLYFMKYIWRRADFEGFYIMELKINHQWSDCYKSW
jgi:hypothetical protein